MTNLISAREYLKTKGLDALLVSSPSQINYLIAYNGFSSVERDAYVLVTTKEVYIFSNPLYSEDLRKKCKGIILIEHTAKNPFATNLKKIVEDNKLIEIGFENDNITVDEYLKITAQIQSHLIATELSQLRNKKTITETAAIFSACQLADTAFKFTKKKIKVGMTEEEIALIFELKVRKLGASLSFPTIVAFGENAATPHHQTDKTKLKQRELIMMDFGVRVDNYCSDSTRTFFIGYPTKEEKKVYDIVLTAQKMAVELIESLLHEKKPILASEVDRIAREYIIEQGFDSIPHALGHGIGIEVHEAPKISPISKQELTEGMVFSIEPGIYLPKKFGVRIEDLYTIKDNKLIQLTDTS